MTAIYKMRFDCGRIGQLHGIFTADTDDMAELIASRKEVRFGEVLGKHSDVYGPIDDSDITLVTDDPQTVEMFERYNMATGYDPFCYIEENEE